MIAANGSRSAGHCRRKVTVAMSRSVSFLVCVMVWLVPARIADAQVSALPDLTITAGPTVTPSSVAPGNTVELSPWTVSNQGEGPSGDFGFGFYLSTDRVITSSDTLLGGDSHAGLAPGESSIWGGRVAPGNFTPRLSQNRA